MKYENPICEIVEIDADIVTTSGYGGNSGGSSETPIIPA